MDKYMNKIKSKISGKSVLLTIIGVLLIIAMIALFFSLSDTVEYTIKDSKNVTDNQMMYETVSSDKSSNVYTVKYVDGRICVIRDNDIIHEVDLEYSNLSSYDKERLIHGITVDSENELLYLTQYLES